MAAPSFVPDTKAGANPACTTLIHILLMEIGWRVLMDGVLIRVRGVMLVRVNLNSIAQPWNRQIVTLRGPWVRIQGNAPFVKTCRKGLRGSVPLCFKII